MRVDLNLQPPRRCGSCLRGSPRGDGLISCGAAVDDAALERNEVGRNPIWAVRKYSRSGLIQALMGRGIVQGLDCERMPPDDGRECVAFDRRLTIASSVEEIAAAAPHTFTATVGPFWKVPGDVPAILLDGYFSRDDLLAVVGIMNRLSA